MIISSDEANLITELVQYVRNISGISVEHARAANLRIQGAAFLTDGTKGQLNDLIDSKVVVRPRGKTHFRSHENYQTEACWRTYAMTTLPDDAKLQCIANQMTGLGMTLTNQDEHSIAEAAALALHTSGNALPDFHLQATRQLKWMLSAVCVQMLPTEARPSRWSRDVADFKQAYPKWYAFAFGTHPPAPCPLDLHFLGEVKARATCRKSKQPIFVDMTNGRQRGPHDIQGMVLDQPAIGRTISRQPFNNEFQGTYLGRYANHSPGMS